MGVAESKKIFLRREIKELEEERNRIEDRLRHLKRQAGLDEHTDYASWIDREGNLIRWED